MVPDLEEALEGDAPVGLSWTVLLGFLRLATKAVVFARPLTVAEAFDGARAYPDGRWLWLPMEDDTMANDVRRLVAIKSPPPRRVRRVR